MNRRRAAAIAAVLAVLPLGAACAIASAAMAAHDAIRRARGKPPLRRRGMTS